MSVSVSAASASGSLDRVDIGLQPLTKCLEKHHAHRQDEKQQQERKGDDDQQPSNDGGLRQSAAGMRAHAVGRQIWRSSAPLTGGTRVSGIWRCGVVIASRAARSIPAAR